MYNDQLLSYTTYLMVYLASRSYFDAIAQQKRRKTHSRSGVLSQWMKSTLENAIDGFLDEYRQADLSPPAQATIDILRERNILQYLLSDIEPPTHGGIVRDVTTVKYGSFAAFLKKRGFPQSVVSIINTFTRQKSRLKKLPRVVNTYTAPPTVWYGSRKFKKLHKSCGVCDLYRGKRFYTSYGQYLVLAAMHSGQVNSQFLSAIPRLSAQYVILKKEEKAKKKKKQPTTTVERDSELSWNEMLDLEFPELA